MTSLHVICNLGPPQSKILATPMARGQHFFSFLKMGHGHDLHFTLPRKTAKSKRKICEDLFCLFYVLKTCNSFQIYFMFWRHASPLSWLQVLLSLASKGSVLEKSVLGPDFFYVFGLEGCILDSTSDVSSSALQKKKILRTPTCFENMRVSIVLNL